MFFDMSCDIFSSQNCKWGGALAPTIDAPPLPVSFRIDFKILTPSRSLRSSGTELLTVPKVRIKRHGEAAFSFYAPSLWNTLPEYLRMAVTVETFNDICNNLILLITHCKIYSFDIYLFTYLCLFSSVCTPPQQLSLSLTITVLSSPLRCQCGQYLISSFFISRQLCVSFSYICTLS